MRGDRRWFDRVASAGTVAALSDRELLRRFVARADDRAFAALMARHGPMVLGVCRRHLDDGHAAEDAFQATWLVLVRRAGSLRDADRLGPWLHGVARRVALRARRVVARRRAVERLGLDHDPPAVPEPDDDRAARQSALDEEVARMPERLRSPLVLCYLEGLTHEEAAHRLGCPLGTVRSRIARSRVLLRDRLARRGLMAPEVGLATPSAWLFPSVPEGLFDATCRAGLGVASGSSLAATGVSSLVVTLTTEAVRMLQISRWTTRVLALSLVGITAGGAWMAASHGRDQPPDPMASPTPGAAAIPALSPVTADEPADLRGVVVDPDGKPVAGATVLYGVNEPGRSGHEVTRTNPTGEFTCRRSAAADILGVVVYQEGFQVLTYSSYRTPDRPQNLPVRLALRKVEPFRGTLLDVQGKPVAGAEVRVLMYAEIPDNSDRQAVEVGATRKMAYISYRQMPRGVISGSELEPLFRTRTDATGAFELQALGGESVGLKLLVTGADGQSYRVSTGAKPAGADRPKLGGPGFTMPPPGEAMEQQGFMIAAPGRPATLVTVPAARIEGRVVSRIPGHSVAGMTAVYQQSQPMEQPSGNLSDRIPVDTDGRFVFDGLTGGTVNVVVHGLGENKDWTYRAAQDVELRPGQTSAVTIELIRGVEVTGTVLRVFSEQPVGDAMVGTYGPFRPRTGAMTQSVTTDGQGRYRYRLPSGETYFYIMGFKDRRPRPEGPSGLTVTIPDGATSFQVPPIYIGAEAAKSN